MLYVAADADLFDNVHLSKWAEKVCLLILLDITF